MRILFGFAGGSGHFIPLVPIARAAEAAGHEIAASPPAMTATVRRAGFTAYPTGAETMSRIIGSAYGSRTPSVKIANFGTALPAGSPEHGQPRSRNYAPPGSRTLSCATRSTSGRWSRPNAWTDRTPA